jgi:hypothetical protein
VRGGGVQSVQYKYSVKNKCTIWLPHFTFKGLIFEIVKIILELPTLQILANVFYISKYRFASCISISSL